MLKPERLDRLRDFEFNFFSNNQKYFLLFQITLLFVMINMSLSASPKHYYIKRYTTWNGLLQNTIRAVKQDEFGRIWIGTAEGLSIYDGNQFTNYTKNDGLSGSVINCFYQVDSTTMWVSVVGGGISILKKSRFHPDYVADIVKGKKYFVDDRINAIFKDSKGRVWFCTDSGISCWSSLDYKACKVRHFNKKNEPGDLFTFSAAEDKNGVIWFGSDDGLIKYDGKKFTFVKGYSKTVWIVRTFKNNKLLLGTKEGVLIYSNGKFRKAFQNPILNSSEIDEIYKDKNSNLWIASTNGLYKYDGKKLKNFSLNGGSQSKFILSFLIGKSGNTWVGTVDGLDQIMNRNFYYINAKYKYSYLWQFVMKGKNEVYTATKDGLYKIKNNQLVYSYYNKFLPSKMVTSVVFKKDGTKWFSTAEGLVEVKNGKRKLYTKKNGFDSNYILMMIDGGKDSIWVGTKGYWKPHFGKVYLVVHDSIKLLPQLAKIPGDPVTALMKDSHNNLWFGFFAKGLYRLSGNKLKKFTSSDGLTDLNIRDIYEDKNGNVWVMTRYSGIYEYKNGKFKNYNIKDGLISNWTQSAVQDRYGKLYFNTAEGVCSFNGKTFTKIVYGGDLMSGEMWASNIDQHGNLLFANSNYIFIFNPKPRNADPSFNVFINKFISKGKTEFPKNKNIIKLNYSSSPIEIEYSCINFRIGEPILYQYKLKGLNKNWLPLTKRNYTTFNHLNPGKYRFYVRAKKNDGNWSKVNAGLTFIINAPYWQEAWFIILISLAAIGFVSSITVFIYRFRVKQILRVERLRTKIATDLHDDIGANLSSISIFSELAKINIQKAPEKASKIVNNIGEISRTLVDNMSDIVWAINPETDNFNATIFKMKDFAFSILQAKKIKFVFNVEENLSDLKLTMEIRRNLLLIFKEIINNAAKYSNASYVEVSLGLLEDAESGSGKGAYLTVSDNGIGFDIDSVKRGNGINNINRRIHDLNGKLKIESIQKAGTKIRIFIPFNI